MLMWPLVFNQTNVLFQRIQLYFKIQPTVWEIYIQNMCLLLFIVICNCQHFASDHFHFQLSSLCNWPSSRICPVYDIPSVGVKGTYKVLWSSANFCSISQNMHYKAPVGAQHWKTNKVVWTWKDDWPPWRNSTYKRPFTREGNYLV